MLVCHQRGDGTYDVFGISLSLELALFFFFTQWDRTLKIGGASISHVRSKAGSPLLRGDGRIEYCRPLPLRLQPHAQRGERTRHATGKTWGAGPRPIACSTMARCTQCTCTGDFFLSSLQPGSALGQALPVGTGEGHICLAPGPVDGVAAGHLVRVDALRLERHLVLLVVSRAEGLRHETDEDWNSVFREVGACEPIPSMVRTNPLRPRRTGLETTSLARPIRGQTHLKKSA